MVKSFLILVSLQIFLYSSQQIVLVISPTIDSSKAKLSCFEDAKQIFKTIAVNLGKNGLGVGIGKIELKNTINIPLKYEGDKKAPLGIFKLTHIFGYKKQNNSKMPYLYADNRLICVDDSKHKNYNHIINIPKDKPTSFEYMKRKDLQYELGIVVEHNKEQIEKRGSCIFLHVQKDINTPTAGCTSMKLDYLKKIINWLDIEKNPILIQVDKNSLEEVYKLYPQLK